VVAPLNTLRFIRNDPRVGSAITMSLTPAERSPRHAATDREEQLAAKDGPFRAAGGRSRD